MRYAQMARASWIWTAVLALALTVGCAKQRIYTMPPGSEVAVVETAPGGAVGSAAVTVPEVVLAQQPAAESDILVSEDLPEISATPITSAPAKTAPAASDKALSAAAASVKTPSSAPEVQRLDAVREAQATVYDQRGLAARLTKDSEDLPTASGDLYDPQAFTAAHRTLPLGTSVRVTNLANGRSTTVLVNDRGPFDKARIIDLSAAAAEAIGLAVQSTTEVGLTQVGGPAKAPSSARESVPPAVGAAAETPIHSAQEAVQAVSGGYWVQVGAFTDKINAERVLEGLVRDGYVQSRLVIAPGNGLFRVQAGLFSGEADAQSALARLKGAYPASYLVRD